MIVLIDNYDSFVYNLARYVEELGQPAHVLRNDAVTVDEVRELQPAAIILSPGPGRPEDAGICLPLLRETAGTVPILGVCLGHQAIAAAAGGRIIRAPLPVHGQASEVQHCGHPLLAELPRTFAAARYHSLLVDEASLPAALEVIAHTADGLPMAIANREHPVYGVQFHPESVLSTGGHRLLASFLRLAGVQTGPVPAGDLPAAGRPENWPPTPASNTASAGGPPLHW